MYQHTRHMFNNLDGTIDLDKQRADALRVSQGDARNKPQEVVIHLHRQSQACEFSQDDKHEHYRDGARV